MINNNVFPQAFSDLARIHLSQAYAKIGRNNEAKEVLNLEEPFCSIHGGTPIYLDTDYNKIMRDVALQYNLDMIEAGLLMDEIPSDYIDYCHPDPHGHKRIAQLLYKRISHILNNKHTLDNIPISKQFDR